MNRVCAAFMLLAISVGVNCDSSSFEFVNVSGILDNMLNNYDKRLRPNFGGAAVDVKISMYVIGISELSDENMDFTLDFYFRQFWRDSRLSFDKKANLEKLSLGHEFGKSIWLPDTFFVQDKRESFMHTVTAKNEFIKIDHAGNVARSIRLSVTASCPMNFKHFPMDTQKCSLDIESYGQKADGIRYHWQDANNSVLIGDLTVFDFELIGHKESSEDIVVSSGTYSRLSIEFEFKRLIGYYHRQIYIPCLMIVILSWISFWLKRGSSTRLHLCMLSLLLMCIGCTLLGFEMPKTNYTKAIDVYTGVCMTFVFVALVEYLFVNNYSCESDKDCPTKLDKFFRCAYPTAFIIFAALYWIVY